jgi:ribose 1,5-bisphosphokinase PhnN
MSFSASEIGMAFAKTEKEWAERAAKHLKVELKRAEVTYDVLAERLKEHGFEETKASIANKLARATMTAHFYLASLAAIGRPSVSLEEI